MGNDRKIPPLNLDGNRAEALRELKAIRAELTGIRKLLDHFCGVFLNARFPHGKAIDRWTRH
jgi:hypothetical protein